MSNTSAGQPHIIWHIISRDQWAQAQATGAHRGDTLDSEGFIHCSTAEQVLLPANALFRGRPDLVLLRIHADKVQPEIRYEQSGEMFFPHIYGPLNVDAVVQVVDFPPSADGTFALPDMQTGEVFKNLAGLPPHDAL